ncbi:1-acyl-sn-glycerol-3-phosphate acyltransferase [Candidatus Saccharibacteria bacterium]|nr:1-acyl-sn-glycerol-3-phosphate acyltransferase [Candidatus Saccharibacteria bacterium]
MKSKEEPTSRHQDATVPADYPYNKRPNPLERLIYFLLFLYAKFHLKFILKTTVKNKKILPKNSPFFLYANHTQPLGDPFLAVTLFYPNTPRVLVSPANLGIPFIGRFLHLAALPIPSDLKTLKRFNRALKDAYETNHPIIIFPEAHVLPYCPIIREISEKSFRPAAKLRSDVYVMTTTYKKPKFGKKPRIIVHLDGPLSPDPAKTASENASFLCTTTLKTLHSRTKNNYIYYP